MKKKAIDTQVGGSHYKEMAIQPVEFIVANDIPYREANAIKYLCRWESKGGIKDLEKAVHYIQMIIDDLKAFQEEEDRYEKTLSHNYSDKRLL